MYDFLEKLFRVVLPRMRDFQGLSEKSFDGRGNYNLGIREWSVFPEVDTSKVQQSLGLQITIVTSTNQNKRAATLLAKMGLPFVKNKNKHGKKK
jgi:large subunit ribosomal protein L5